MSTTAAEKTKNARDQAFATPLDKFVWLTNGRLEHQMAAT